MTIKEHMQLLGVEMDKRMSDPASKMRTGALLLGLQAELMDDNVVVDADVFEVMSPDLRRMCLMSMIIVAMQTSQAVSSLPTKEVTPP